MFLVRDTYLSAGMASADVFLLTSGKKTVFGLAVAVAVCGACVGCAWTGGAPAVSGVGDDGASGSGRSLSRGSAATGANGMPAVVADVARTGVAAGDRGYPP